MVEFVEYHLYSTSPQEVSLQEISEDIGRACKQLCSEYFWQREEPVFWFKDHSTPPCLHGKFETGDSVDDEWTMVYLLMQLTSIFPFLVATIQDADGEFLLIEAAEVLPRWLDRVDASINRVFIKGGKVVIIPQDIKVHSLLDGLKNINTAKNYPAIQKVVESCAIESYQQPKHNARVSLPEKAWRMIHSDPSLTSKAVDTLYRNNVDLQYEAQSDNILPPENIIQTTIRFSRSAFAQLACQPYEPLPLSKWSKRLNRTTLEELGMKLVCGLEMLLANSGILMIPDEPVPPNEEPEDSLRWMELDEMTFDDDFLKPNKVDRIAEKFESFTKAFDSDEFATETSEDSFLMENLSDIEASSSFDDNDDSDDDTFLEKEILETIKNDPDLLMKIVERAALDPASQDYVELFEKLRLTECTTKQGTMRQKGLADLSESSKREIEAYKRKIEELRRKRTEPTNEDDVENDAIPRGSSSEEETELYSPNFKDIYSKYKNVEVPSSDSEAGA